MGYGSSGVFLDVMRAIDTCDIEYPPSICELGDQKFTVFDYDVPYLQQFVEHYGCAFDKDDCRARVNTVWTTGDVYRNAGFSYMSMDLNENDDSIPVDLNIWPPEIEIGEFDIVTNFGTTEHLGNQLAAFAIVHYATKKNGIMLHHVPILNYSAHALVTVTGRFFRKLIDMNNYRILRAEVQAHDVPKHIGIHHGHDTEFIPGFREMMEAGGKGAMGYFILQKQDDNPFAPPLDIGAGWDIFAPILDLNIRRFLRGMEHRYPEGVDAAVARTIEQMRAMRTCPTQIYMDQWKPISAS